jgi:hypothetical protein
MRGSGLQIWAQSAKCSTRTSQVYSLSEDSLPKDRDGILCLRAGPQQLASNLDSEGIFALMVVGTLAASWFAFAAPHRAPLQVSLSALAFSIILAGISYPLFGLSEVRRNLRARFGMA